MSSDSSHEPILLSPPDVGPAERDALLSAFDSGWIAPAGPSLNEFEEALVAVSGREAAVALSSGSAGLELGLIAAGVKPGDEVIVQTATFAASAFAAVHIGAIPVFCDVSPATWCLDPEMLRSLLDTRLSEGKPMPAAIMPVDLYGRVADYPMLEAVARHHGIPIVEDAAEAIGSQLDGQPAGSFGECGVFSFNGNKIITTSGGGALVGSAEFVDHVRHLSTQARQPVVHYEHEHIGYNARLSNLLAALGVEQLRSLPTKIERRLSTQRAYREALTDLDWPTFREGESPNGWLAVALLPSGIDPTSFCNLLAEDRIEARPAWKPMHQQPIFAGLESVGGEVADEIFDRGVCLPTGSTLTNSCVERVIESSLLALERSI